MANWYYYDKNGEKVGPISVADLKALIKQGVITRETVIENLTGRTQKAGEVRGLSFPETTQPDTTPPKGEPEVYGIASPQPAPPQPEKPQPAKPQPAKPQYFYIDQKGQKQGPISVQQLQALAVRGMITPQTPLETTSGQKGKAGQFRGLKFATTVDSPFVQQSPFVQPAPENKISHPSIKRFNTYFTVFWICMVVGIPLSFFSIGIPILIIGVAFGAMLLYQCWKLIPVNIARTTPGKAVGYSFIPFFNVYWVFVAFKGLGKDMNNTLQQRGIPFRVNSLLGMIFCRLTLAGFCLGVAFYFVGAVLADTGIARNIGEFLIYVGLAGSILCNIVALVVCTVFLRSVKNGAVVLLEPERANQIQSENDSPLALLAKVMGCFSTVKEAVQARTKLNAINTQLIAAYRSLGDAAEKAGWDGVLCESIKKQREEVAVMTSQQEKAAADAELTQNTPSAGAAKQALAEAKKRAVFVSSVLDGLREKTGRKLWDDATAPTNIGTEQRIEIARLAEKMAEYERVIAHGKTSLFTKPMLVAASVMVLLVAGIFGMVAVFSVTNESERKAPRYSSSPEYLPSSPTRKSSQEHMYKNDRGSWRSGMSEREARDFREKNRSAAARREGELNIKECGTCKGTGRFPYHGSTCSLCDGDGFLWTNTP